MAETRGTVRTVSPEETETIDILGADLRVLSDGVNVPALIGEHVVPPGYGVPRHVHDAEDEIFVILEGELTVTGPAGDAPARAGACVQLPRGIPHGFRNDGVGPVRLVAIVLPGRQALAMFRRFDGALRGTQPPTPPEIVSIAEEHGVRFV